MQAVRVRSRPGTTPAAPPAVDPTRSRQRPVAELAAAERTESVAVERRSSGETMENASEVSHHREPVAIEGPHATVHVGGKATVQIVKFESVSVSVGIWLPCPPTPEGVEAAYAEGSAWVDSKITRELALARGELIETV